MKYLGSNGEFLELGCVDSSNCKRLKNSKASELSLIWFLEGGSRLRIDNEEWTFEKNEIISLTEFHKIESIEFTKANFLRWNKHFYCIINHDSEVGCKGILFYGASGLPVMRLTAEELEKFTIVWKMLEQEMTSRDSLQEEMLQMMLKRILILCTRIYKERTDIIDSPSDKIDIIREYHFLVEQYFKEKHTVAEYAELLHKSPKTLSNMFKKFGSKSPLQYIKDRKMLEARRLLKHTDKSVSEIGYDLGFTEVQAFSRFFKKEEGISPLAYRD